VPGTIVTSTEVRVPLLRVATDVAREHFWAGAGFAAYPQAYAQAADRVPDPDPETKPYWGRSDNPHNEYLMQLGAGGVGALALFLLWVGWPMARGVRRGAPAAAGVLGCVAAAFAVGCLFNSLLLDFTEGHFYAALLAWGLARRDAA
jgi:O-antigen ligase